MTEIYEPGLACNNSLCRICFEKHPCSVRITGDMLVKYQDFVGDLVTNGSNFLCSKCVLKLCEFHKFKAKAQASNDLWNANLSLGGPQFNTQSDEGLIKVEVQDSCSDNEDLIVKVEVEEPPVEIVKTRCLECNKDFKNAMTLKCHLRKCSKSKEVEKRKCLKTYNCGLCDKVLDTPNSKTMDEHVGLHFSRNDLICQLCDFKGFDFADMELHRFSHQKSILMWCHICGWRTKKPSRKLLFHFRTKHITRSNSCACLICNKTFTSYKWWRWHEKSHSEPKFKCDLCGKEFTYKKTMRSHMIENHLKRSQQICHICGFSVYRKRSLKLHMAVHNKLKPVECSHCNRKFKSQTHLDKHLTNINKPKTLSCPHCPKKFSDTNSRDSHVFYHSGEKPFRCTICNSTYKAKAALKIHLRKHTGERPYVCNVCTRSFTSTTLLKKHQAMHTGVKLYKCELCEKSFHEKRKLQLHVQKVHSTMKK